MTPYTTSPENILDIFGIAMRMRAAGLSLSFVSSAALMALEFEGTFDLMLLWDRESDQKERDEIVADIQDEIDSWKESPSEHVNVSKINFDELDEHVEKIVDFKKGLRRLVDQWGGIQKLAEATGMPQPSLSRFFNSASLPRKITLLKIRDALLPPEISEDWEPAYTIEQLQNAMAGAWENNGGVDCH